MTLHVKESGTWREVDQPFANVGGTWKTVREVHVKHGGSWRLAHTTPYTEYNLGSYVLEQNIGVGESGTYTVPTGQGIAYIWIYLEGQSGGGGGGVYTPTYYPCVNGGVPSNQNHYPGGPTTTTKTALGGYGGLGGTITCIHRVYDGDYVSWNGYSDGPANGGGGAGYSQGGGGTPGKNGGIGGGGGGAGFAGGAGSGGGSARNSGSNGTNGGNSTSYGGNAGTNTGGGGGGGSGNTSSYGGNGASGIVIIKYQYQNY